MLSSAHIASFLDGQKICYAQVTQARSIARFSLFSFSTEVGAALNPRYPLGSGAARNGWQSYAAVFGVGTEWVLEI